MKEQRTGTREKGTDSIEAMLRNAISPMDASPGPPHDLWPAMQVRLRAQPLLAAKLRSVPWFDWALAGGLAIFALVFPAAVPMLLYYL